MYAGLRAAFYPDGEPRPQDLSEGPDTIFLLTDGDPSEGKYKAQEGPEGRGPLVEPLARDPDQLRERRRRRREACSATSHPASGGVYMDLQSERKPEEPLK